MKLSGWTIAGIGVAAWLVYTATRAVSTVKKLQVRLADIRFSNVQLLQSTMYLKLNIVNSTTTALSFDSVYGTVWTMGATIAAVDYAGGGQPISIQPGSNTVEVPVVIQHVGAAAGMVSIIAQLLAGTLNQEFVINADVTVGGIVIPIKQAITLTKQGISGLSTQTIYA